MDSLVSAHNLRSCGEQTLELWDVGSLAPQNVGPLFPEQRSNPRPPHCKADSQPVDHQGSSVTHFKYSSVYISIPDSLSIALLDPNPLVTISSLSKSVRVFLLTTEILKPHIHVAILRNRPNN